MGWKGLGLAMVCALGTVTAFADGDKASDLIKAHTDYQRYLYEARVAEADIKLKAAETALAYAEAHKMYAEADYIRQKIAHLREFSRIMVAEYARVQKEEADLKYRMYEVRKHYDLCGELADGTTKNGAFQCLQYFRRYVVSFGLQKKILFDDKIEALPSSEFIPNYSDMSVTAFPGGNLGQLLVFAERGDYSFAPFGRAHSFVIQFLDAVQSAAQAKIMEYRNWIDGIRAGTLDVFKLPG